MLLYVLGWVGNTVEIQWVRFVLDSISDKLAAVASYSVGECDLLIYDNTPLPVPDLKTAAEGDRLRFVKETLADGNERSFRAISVIRDAWLIYDIARKPQMLRYDVAWDNTTDTRVSV
jgi:hypothetical protein